MTENIDELLQQKYNKSLNDIKRFISLKEMERIREENKDNEEKVCTEIYDAYLRKSCKYSFLNGLICLVCVFLNVITVITAKELDAPYLIMNGIAGILFLISAYLFGSETLTKIFDYVRFREGISGLEKD